MAGGTGNVEVGLVVLGEYVVAGAGFLPATCGHYPDDYARYFAAHFGSWFRPNLVRHYFDHQHGTGPDYTACGFEPFRDQRHCA